LGAPRRRELRGADRADEGGASVSLWLVILIIVLIALLLGGFGYRRYY
jgi:hypothetical protein